MTNQTGISIKLPDINVEAITNLQEAKKIITLLLNIIEQQAKQITIFEEKIILLEKELALLKQQPRKPEYFSQQKSSFSASKLLKKCTLPITGLRCVKRIVSDMAVLDVVSGVGFKLLEHAPGISVEQIKNATEGKLIIEREIPEMKI